ncbi:hypothetical protein B5S28_g3944 [[Candida] boidinii]|nr:hypothetical protein B5S28_g3944 [[Candida] boidinii]OWB61339.1 hypothetical protein B5S29_g2228 [[Candida] boidinii]
MIPSRQYHQHNQHLQHSHSQSQSQSQSHSHNQSHGNSHHHHQQQGANQFSIDKLIQINNQLSSMIKIQQIDSKNLNLQLKKLKLKNIDSNLFEISYKNSNLINNEIFYKNYNTLKGHFNKILSCSWHPNNQNILSCSQDGYLIMWDAITGMKLKIIQSDDPYVTSSDISPNGKLIAIGGLANNCYVYSNTSNNTNNNNNGKLISIFKGHKEYISDLSFVNNESIITCSGDKTCNLWDLNKGKQIQKFYGHVGDVLNLSINPINENTFITCSSDGYANLWDIRLNSKNFTRNFKISSDCDSSVIQFFPDGNSFNCGLDNGLIKLIDLRSDGELAIYPISRVNAYMKQKRIQPTQGYTYYSNLYNPFEEITGNNITNNTENLNGLGIGNNNNSTTATNNNISLSSRNNSIKGSPTFLQNSNSFKLSPRSSIIQTMENTGVLSIDNSKSGRLLFASYSEFNEIIIWDTLNGKILGTLNGHTDNISNVKVSNDGLSIVTASRDNTLKIWSV